MIRYVFGINPDKTTNRTIYGGKLTVNARIYRGAPGESGAGIQTVNSVSPDGNGNVPLTAANIPETSTRFWLTDVLKAAYDGAVTALNALLLTGQRLITSVEISKLSNTSGTNTGDETTSTIQTKRPLKTVGGNSLDGAGDIPFPTVDLTSYQIKAIVVNSNITAVIDSYYTVVATATITDPSPVEGKGFRVMVRNGTATVGGVGYSTAGTVILRIFDSGSWANYVYQVAGGGDSPVVLYCDTTPITFTGVLNTETTIRDIPIPANIGNGYLYIRYNIKIQTAVSAAASTARVRIGNVGSNPFTDNLLATNGGTTVSNIDIYRHTPLIGGASGNIKRSTPQGSNIRNDDSAIGQYLDTVNVDWTVAKSIKLSCVLNNAGNVVISDGALVIFYPEKL